MPIAEDSAGGSPVPIPTNLTTNLTGEATGSGTLDYTTGDIDIAVTVVDNGHNHILSNITDVQVNNAISGQILVYNGTVWANATNTSGITAIVQDLTPQLGGNLDLNGKNINGNGNINLADNYKLTLGTGNDLELSHDGVSSYIRDVGAGDLQIFASDDVYIRGQGTNTYMARFNESGAVTLYHNNVVRLITTDSGITVTDEVEAAEFIGPLRGPTKFKGQAGEALSAGDPVYISGISGNITVVSKADANDANKMPAFGIIETSVSANASCQVLTFGEMHNLDTSAFSEGDELYVSNTGTLTTTIPSGESSQIQKIAKVTRSHASVGSIFIMGAGRSNAVPNLDNGDIFIGDGTNHATTTSLNTAVNALTLTNYLPLSGGAMTGNITTSGTFDGRNVSVDGAKLDGIEAGADVTLNEISAGTNVTISAGGVISSTASGGLAHVVDDTTPQLGGNLDLNSNDITGTGNLNFTGNVTLSGTVDGRDVASDGTKLDGIEASADVTDTANVTAAGALMDSEVTNLAQVKAFDSSDYATSAQGTTADAALPKAGGTMTGDILFNDGIKAKFGTSSDLQIWHNGTDSYVYDTGAGDLILRGSSNIKLQSAAGTALSTFTAAGASTLYYSAAEKLATTSTGIDVTGKAGINVASPSAYLHIKDDTAANDDYDVQIESFRPNLVFEDISGSATDYQIFVDSNTMKFLYGDASTNTKLANEVLEINTSGLDVTGNIDVSTSGASNTSKGLAIATSGTNFESDGGIISIDHAAIGAVTGGYFSKYSAGGTLRHSVKGDGKGYFAGGLDVIGTSNTRQWSVGTAGAKMGIYALDNSTMYMRVESGTSSNLQFGTYDNIPIYTITNNTVRTTLTADGKFGVGTTGPTSLMHLASTAPYITFEDTDNNQDWQIQATAWFAIRDQTANAERMRIDSSGRVGVGHTSPVAKMAILGSSNSTITEANSNLCVEGSGGNGLLFGTLNTTGFKSYIQSGFVSNLGTATYALQLNPLGGNVGIGTTTCADKLHVEGNVYLGTSSRSVYCGGGGDLRLQTGTGEVKILTDNGATTNLITSGTGINIPANLDVGNALNVGGASASGSGFIESTAVGSSRALQTVGNVNTTQTHIGFENLSGEIGRIDVSAFSVSYVTSSDYRLKTDIQPMQGSIDRVKALRPVNFEWVNDGGRVDGFIAHEAQEVVPESISGEKDAMRDQQYVESEATGDIYTPAVEATYETIQVELTPAVEATYDEDGNELTPAVDATYEEQQQELTPAIDEVIHSTDVVEPDELEEGQLWRETTEKVMATRQVPDYQGIDQAKLVPLLTSALQDAIAKIEALETRLEALES